MNKGEEWMASDDLFELEGTLRKIAKKITKEWRRHNNIDLSRTEAIVLYILHEKGQQRASQLAQRLSITTGGMTGITDKLVDEGYIQRKRDNKDRRVVYLTISEK